MLLSDIEQIFSQLHITNQHFFYYADACNQSILVVRNSIHLTILANSQITDFVLKSIKVTLCDAHLQRITGTAQCLVTSVYCLSSTEFFCRNYTRIITKRGYFVAAVFIKFKWIDSHGCSQIWEPTTFDSMSLFSLNFTRLRYTLPKRDSRCIIIKIFWKTCNLR